MDEDIKRLEEKIDRLTSMLAEFIRYELEQDKQAFGKNLSANILADFLFEAGLNPNFPFDTNGRR